MSRHGGARVALRCDAGPTLGVGHAMRCVALGEELTARGHEVLLWGDLGDIGWLQALVAAHGYAVVPAPGDPSGCAREADALSLDAVVLDGYHLDTGIGSALAAPSRRLLTLVDYDFGVRQHADVYVDQNLGALPHPGLPARATVLAGIDYALFRDTVRDRRRATPQAPGRPVRVVAVFGGTDAFGAAPVVVPALLATGEPVEVTVVAARPESVDAVRAMPTAAGQTVQVVAPDPDFGALVADADLVLSASGSSVWELLCMGVPAAVVCVVDNQESGYRQGLDRGVVAGLGHLGRFDAAAATATLAELVTDASRREGYATRGQALVDGAGRERVANALLP
ncbi:PseG/SpsG family protein [Allobranchiibius sp. GilTou73]|uniref:PseG/SpsG family protein n=1 Tax=Allobranchiibius sp. GilTou73 TaxID=2904523 RepID=UPI001F454A85|nr:hypothetical protein [Allobranchiibius sp. GilTou73]UIJ34644.1 hypothetical protein LVQ62_16335 [Allobranchiibius sp. GilTou73]